MAPEIDFRCMMVRGFHYVEGYSVSDVLSGYERTATFVVRCEKPDGHKGKHRMGRSRPRRPFKVVGKMTDWALVDSLPGVYYPAYCEPVWGMGVGRRTLRNVHPITQCQRPPGEHRPCVMHNPTDHPMRTWVAVYRDDRQGLIERQCPHGVGHPDPDYVWFAANVMGDDTAGYHGCDGCCRGAFDDE